MKTRLIFTLTILMTFGCKKETDLTAIIPGVDQLTNSLRVRGAINNFGYDIIVSTVAGTSADINQNDGYAKHAEIWIPMGLVTDASNNIIFADNANHCIRRLSTSGVLSTLAGNGMWGYNDGTGQGVRFCNPSGITLNGSGDIMIADEVNNRIRKLTSAGVVSTYAGSTAGFQNGSLTTAQFWAPSDVAIDPTTGDIIVCDMGNCAIRRITTGGIVTTVAGDGRSGYIDGPGATARFAKPTDIIVDVSGNIYVTDAFNHAIRKINTSQVVSTLTGGTPGYTNGTLATAQFTGPYGIAMDASKNLFVGDVGNYAIRKIDIGNNSVTTIAGGNGNGFLDGNAANSQFSTPANFTIDNSGDLLISDIGNSRIRKLASGTVSTLTGNGKLGFQDGTASGSLASLYYPSDVFSDANNNLIIGDLNIRHNSYSGILSTLPQLSSFNFNFGVTGGSGGDRIVSKQSCVYKISSAGSVTLIAGDATATGYVDANGSSARFMDIRGVVVDGSGNIFVADYGNNTIRKIDPSNDVTTFAGLAGTGGTTDGIGANARFNHPWGLDIDASGNLYLADDYRIRKITSGASVSTVYISPGFTPILDVVYDPIGGFVVFTTWESGAGSYVKKLDIASSVVTTIAGSGTAGFVDGPGTSARFENLYGIIIDKRDNIIVADAFNGAIRKISGHWRIYP